MARDARSVRVNDGWQDAVARYIADTAAVGTIVGRTESGSRSFLALGVTGLDTPRAVDEHTIFAAYSISKAFTALAVVRLCLRDGIDLDEPVNRRLRDLKVIPADVRYPVTVRHLLTHTGGVPSPTQFVFLTPRYADLVGGVVRCQVAAGQEWEYSNGGFGVLTEWVEQVTGQVFEDALADLVLRPLGMTGSAFRREWPPDAAAPHDASGHPTPRYWPNVLGAGGLCVTAADLLSAAEAACSDQSGFRAIFDVVATPQRPTSYPDVTQGVGFMLRAVGQKEALWHHGAGTGGYGEFFIDRDANVGVALLTNTATDLGRCAVVALENGLDE